MYGFIQAKAIAKNSDNSYEKEFEKWLEWHGLSKDKKYIRESKGEAMEPYTVTLPTFIRNLIHHPENQYNDRYSDEELKDSIEALLGIYESLS